MNPAVVAPPEVTSIFVGSEEEHTYKMEEDLEISPSVAAIEDEFRASVTRSVIFRTIQRMTSQRKGKRGACRFSNPKSFTRA